MKCKICHQNANEIFRATVLDRYDVGFHRCCQCGFIQTDEPFWLAESYSKAISDLDLGSVNRAIQGSRFVEGLLLTLFDHSAKFIDYGAGYGIFVRLMRDMGYQFFWSDLYCDNLFAKHFEAKPGMRFELLTAFEVFEHLVNPMDEIARMLEWSDNLAFSTLLVPATKPISKDWWYFSPNHGQHIAFYTVESLKILGEKLHLHLSTDGESLHVLSRERISPRIFRLVVRRGQLAQIGRKLLRRKRNKTSLLAEDFRVVTGLRL